MLNMRLFLGVLIFFIVCPSAIGQDETNTVSDSLYKEDQFYIAITYNLLGKKPNGVSQNGFSSGFHFGYIKDIPINLNRNVAIGLGLGLSTNSFNNNMLISEDLSGNFSYTILNENDISYIKNKFTMYVIELPIEFRWRTSTATEYKFWRIYTGAKLGYVVANSSKFKNNSGTIKNNGITDFNDLQYGLTLSAGYNTWNLHIYYALNPIFSGDAKINNESIDMNAIKIGLIFYIL